MVLIENKFNTVLLLVNRKLSTLKLNMYVFCGTNTTFEP